MNNQINQSKIGELYSYLTESQMLQVAKQLEEEGYKVKRLSPDDYIGVSNYYRVKVIGYK